MARELDETVRVIFLDTRNRIILDELLARGDAREVKITPSVWPKTLLVNSVT